MGNGIEGNPPVRERIGISSDPVATPPPPAPKVPPLSDNGFTVAGSKPAFIAGGFTGINRAGISPFANTGDLKLALSIDRFVDAIAGQIGNFDLRGSHVNHPALNDVLTEVV